MVDLALLADHVAEPLELPGDPVVQLDDVVEGLGDLAIDAGQVARQADREVPLPKRAKTLQEELRLQL